MPPSSPDDEYVWWCEGGFLTSLRRWELPLKLLLLWLSMIQPRSFGTKESGEREEGRGRVGVWRGVEGVRRGKMVQGMRFLPYSHQHQSTGRALRAYASDGGWTYVGLGRARLWLDG
jgi:hypothetical protein